MTAPKAQPSRRTVLSEDGEIQDLDSLLNDAAPHQHESSPEVSASQTMPHESIYCVRCGTANVYNASYCARCGQALVEPGAPGATREAAPADMDGVRKSKRDWQSAVEAEPIQKAASQNAFNPFALVSRLVMLIFMAGMVVTSLVMHGGNSVWVSILILISWLLVEAIQSGRHHLANLMSMLSEIVTMIVVAGVVTTAIVLNEGRSAWLSVIALAAWVIVEAVRN